MSRRNRADRRKANRKKREHDATIKAVAEFYMEVAHSLDLPPKALPAPPPPPPRPTREEAIRAIRAKAPLQKVRELWLPALAGLLLVITAGYYWWPTPKAAVPQDFRGTWISKDPSYAGRMIVVSMETVEIVSGRSAATGPLPVTSAKVDTNAIGVRVRLVYGKPGSDQTLEMLLHPGQPATMTLVRPSNVVWERLEGAPSPPPGSEVARER